MADFIAISVPDLAELQAKLRKLPDIVADEGVDAANEYILNTMRHYAQYRYVSRRQAYGQTFQSEKQRRWFFASLNSGELTIPYPRTQSLSGGWKIIGSGMKSLVANEVPYAAFVQGDAKQQSRHAKLIGWKGVDVVVKERAGEIMRRFSAGAKRAIKILGLS